LRSRVHTHTNKVPGESSSLFFHHTHTGTNHGCSLKRKLRAKFQTKHFERFERKRGATQSNQNKNGKKSNAAADNATYFPANTHMNRKTTCKPTGTNTDAPHPKKMCVCEPAKYTSDTKEKNKKSANRKNTGCHAIDTPVEHTATLQHRDHVHQAQQYQQPK